MKCPTCGHGESLEEEFERLRRELDAENTFAVRDTRRLCWIKQRIAELEEWRRVQVEPAIKTVGSVYPPFRNLEDLSSLKREKIEQDARDLLTDIRRETDE